MKATKYFAAILLISLTTGCKEKFTAPLKSSETILLVVEGNLNVGQNAITGIRLTKSYKLDSSFGTSPVSDAAVVVESKDNSYPLTFSGNGYYSGQYNFTVNNEYRLRIQTVDGKNYLSEYVIAKKNPPIDSITFKEEKGGVQIFINTHDASNNTRYYRWEYEETWEINSPHYSTYKYENEKVSLRDPDEFVYACWKEASSNTIILGSTAQLQSDVIANGRLTFIPPSSEKVSVRYSTLVKQYALSKDAFQYFQLMQKNSETLGSIFDAQPSELQGNIHNISNSDEQVIGYFTASEVTEKRTFIKSSEVPWIKFEMDCPTKEIPNNSDSIKAQMPEYLPVYGIYDGPSVKAWYSAVAHCVDCTLRGGVLTKPSFW
jgi:hypothetical protein